MANRLKSPALPPSALSMQTIALRYAALPAERRAAFRQRLNDQGIDPAGLPVVPITNADKDAPLSYEQEHLWFLWKLQPDDPAYHMSGALELEGELDPMALDAALRHVAERQQSLRTRFFQRHDGEPRQTICRTPWPNCRRHRLLSADETMLGSALHAAAIEPFDLETGPLIRADLFQIEAQRQILLLTLHHIITDGHSMPILVRELAAAYRQAVQGPSSPSAREDSCAALQFRDYAAWQREWLDGRALSPHIDYWRAQLGAQPPPSPLPFDHPRSSRPSMAGARVRREIAAEVIGKLQSQAAAQQATLFMALLAAFGTLLYRYSSLRDLRIGVPSSGRESLETENLIGFFVNTLVIRQQPDGALPFHELLAQTRETLLAAQSHRALPFSHLVRELQDARHDEARPFHAMFSMRRSDRTALMSLPRLRITPREIDTGAAQFELSFNLIEHEEGLRLDIVYASERFETATIERLASHYLVLLEQLADNIQIRLADLHLDGDRPTLPTLPHHPQVPDNVLQRFAVQVRERPQAEAVSGEQDALTYGELDRWSSYIARQLIAQTGASSTADRCIGLCMDRSPGLIAGILGILKSSAAYLPLDPRYPLERLSETLIDAEVSCLVCDAQGIAVLGNWAAQQGIAIIEVNDWPRAEAVTAAEDLAPDPAQLAYVIYTSGSTGQPKGVGITHANLARLFDSSASLFHFGPGDVWTLFHSHAFDFSVWELFGALVHGGRLVIVPYWTARSPQAMQQLLRDQQVTVLNQTPSAFQALMSADLAAPMPFDQVRVLVFGGERLEPASLANWHQARQAAGQAIPTLVNMYGITETTVHVTHRILSDDDIYGAAPGCTDRLPSPIGKALDDLQLYLLDADLNPVPDGGRGELYVGGAGLARGYLHRPALTAERFIPNPFGASGTRLYRSGDLARNTATGELNYLGRNDLQVKIRGFRIELGEVRVVLVRHPNLAAAEVIVHDHPRRGAQLVAYLVARRPSATLRQEIQEYAAAHLPAQLRPAVYIVLEALPLTINGKLDHRALPAPDESELAATSADHAPAALSPPGQRLAALWCDVLGLARVDPDDDFFACGGHSLLAVRLAASIQKTFGVQLPLRTLFDHPKLSELAIQLSSALDASLAAETAPGQRPAALARIPLSYAQERLWFLWQYDPNDTAYNISCAVELEGELNENALRRAFDALTLRHEILRTSFYQVDGIAYQQIHAEPRYEWTLDLREGSSPTARAAHLARLHYAEAQRPFDLQHAPLLRITLIRCGTKHHFLHLSLHHIIADGESIKLLLNEWVALYRQALASGDLASHLPPLPLQYADYAYWQRQYSDADMLAPQLDYWRNLLGEETPSPELFGHPETPLQKRKLARIARRIEQPKLKALHALATAHQTSLFSVLLTAFHILIGRYSAQNTTRIGVPVTGRTHTATRQVIGCFVNTLVMSADLAAADNFSALLKQVRQRTLDAQTHADLPFAKLVEALQPERERGATPLFQVMLNYQQAERQTPGLPGLRITPLETQADTVQFDLKLDINCAADHARLHFDFADAQFPSATIERFADHWLEILDQVIALPTIELRILHLSAPRRAALPLSGHSFLPVPQRIAQVGRRIPHAIALQGQHHSLSYRQLQQQVELIARQLLHHGLQPEQPIAVALPRGPALPASMLATWLAGAVYLPIDPEHPQPRLRAMLEQTATSIAIVDDSTCHLPALADCRLVNLDRPEPIPASPLPSPSIHPLQLAYIIHTSGSTGNPKAVALTHAALDRLLAAMQRQLPLHPHDRWLSASAPIFDISLLEFCLPLLGGSTLHILPAQAARDGSALSHRLEASQASVLQATPSGWRMLLEAGWRTPIPPQPTPLLGLSGGEPLHPELALALSQRGVSLWNLYGPTETTIYSSGAQVLPHTPMTYGNPLPHTVLRVIDPQGQLLPDGAAGELCIGGDQLARGYLRQPALTAAAFLPDPDGPPGARLYRTGDLVRIDQNGQPVPLGRIDQQVKLRGHRIELGEVEAALCACQGVGNAAAAIKGLANRQRLIGYVTGTADPHALRQLLAQTLPPYMVPAAILSVASLPLTASGKLDRRALPEPPWQDPADQTLPPRSQREADLLDIWQRVLGHPVHSVQLNFFEAGGDSILILQLVAQLRHIGWQLTPRQVFEHPSIAEQAKVMTAYEPAPEYQRERHDKLPLSPIQTAFFQQHPDGESHWNQSVLLEIDEPLALERLQAALTALVERHDALRLRFSNDEHGWRQSVASGEEAPLLRHIVWDSEDRQEQLAQQGTAIQQSLDIRHGPLLRAGYFSGERDHRLLIVIHHLAVDGVSWRILLEDLRLLYAGRPLTPLTTPWSAWVAALAEIPRPHAAERAYWQAVLAASPSMLADGLLRTNAPHTADRRLAASRRISVSLAAEHTCQLLQHTSHAYRTRPDELLLAALAQTLIAPQDHESRLLIDLEAHGRRTPLEAYDLSRTVGWFTVQYPLALPRMQTPAATLIAVKEALRAVPADGFHFARTLEGAGPSQRLQRNNQANPSASGASIRFNYLGQFDQALAATMAEDSASMPSMRFSQDYAGPPLAGDTKLDHGLDITALIVDGLLYLHWRFSPDLLAESAVAALAQQTLQRLSELIAHCLTAPAGATAADFPLAQISQSALANIRLPLGEVEDIYPATPLQQGLLFHSLLAGGEGLYLNQLRLTLDGRLNEPALRTAWHRLIAQQPILRTHFELDQEHGPLQIVRRQACLPFEKHDWRHVGADYEIRLQSWLHADLRHDFDPGLAPLLRIALFARSDGAHDLVWTYHHALLDGWSCAQLLQALSRAYHGHDKPESDVAPAPSASYRDYIRWLGQAAACDHASWWRALAVNADEAALLVPSLGTPRHPEPGTHNWSVILDESLKLRLTQATRQAQLTLNTLMQGAWAVLLARYGGRRHAAFGVTVAGRPADLPGAEQMVGLFINTVPLWLDASAVHPIAGWLHGINRLNQDLREHEHTPLTDIQQWTGRSGDALFDTLFVFENYPLEQALEAGTEGLKIRSLRSADRTHYPLTLAVLPRTRLELQWAWDGVHFERASIEALAADYQRILVQFADAILAMDDRPSRIIRLGDIRLSRHLRTRQPARNDDFAPIVPRFMQRAAMHPQHIAVSCRGVELSYRELDTWSARIGWRLKQAGLRADQRVGICITRGVGIPAAILAIWKSGGAYVPLDPGYPRERLAHMLDDAGVDHVLVDAACRMQWGALFKQRKVIDIEEFQREIHATPPAGWVETIAPEQLAYVLYTSGSTGRPKGAAISHRALSLHLADFQSVYMLGSNDIVLQSSTINFDVALHELLPALLHGGRVEMRGPDPWDLDTLNTTLIQAGVTFARMPTSLWQQWQQASPPAKALNALRQITVGGEALAADTLLRWRTGPLAAIRLDNLYGPTETAVAALYRHTQASDTDYPIVPIGSPFPGRGIALLDEDGLEVPPGGSGELCINGASLARGYLERPGLTAARFIPDPEGPPGSRLYRTGDLCRYSPDGMVQFLGRIDQQIKLRGQRIEPGEIEAALRCCEGVTQALIALQGEGAHQRLVAYVVGAAEIGALAPILEQRLPAAWIPSAFVQLKQLPTLPNGKIDRHALPLPDSLMEEEIVAPRNPLEQTIAEVWQEVLAIPRLSVHDHFSALGGHSLLAVQIAARLTRVLQRPVALASVLAQSSVAKLAKHLQQTEAEQTALPQAAQRDTMKQLLSELD